MALPCIACGRALEDATPIAGGNQPYAGTAFVSHGHYGSTVYDPMDGHYIEINVCDECLRLTPERVLEGRDHEPVTEDGCITGMREIPYAEREPLRPWNRRLR